LVSAIGGGRSSPRDDRTGAELHGGILSQRRNRVEVHWQAVGARRDRWLLLPEWRSAGHLPRGRLHGGGPHLSRVPAGRHGVHPCLPGVLRGVRAGREGASVARLRVSVARGRAAAGPDGLQGQEPAAERGPGAGVLPGVAQGRAQQTGPHVRRQNRGWQGAPQRPRAGRPL
jgi:hypothetical protein